MNIIILIININVIIAVIITIYIVYILFFQYILFVIADVLASFCSLSVELQLDIFLFVPAL